MTLHQNGADHQAGYDERGGEAQALDNVLFQPHRVSNWVLHRIEGSRGQDDCKRDKTQSLHYCRGVSCCLRGDDEQGPVPEIN